MLLYSTGCMWLSLFEHLRNILAFDDVEAETINVLHGTTYFKYYIFKDVTNIRIKTCFLIHITIIIIYISLSKLLYAHYIETVNQDLPYNNIKLVMIRNKGNIFQEIILTNDQDSTTKITNVFISLITLKDFVANISFSTMTYELPQKLTNIIEFWADFDFISSKMQCLKSVLFF